MSYRDERYAGVSALVLGAGGFLGRWVARVLCRNGANIALAVRDPARVKEVFERYAVHGDLAVVDLRNKEALARAIRETRPSITFNLAGYGVDRSERDETTHWEINVRLPQWLAEILAEEELPNWPGQRLVHVGSALEYGSASGDLAEDSDPIPGTTYGRAKLAGTLGVRDICERSGMSGLTARLFTVYGPGEHPGRLLPSLLESLKAGGPVRLTAGTQRRDFTYVEDIAEGLLRLGVSAAQRGEIVNLATGTLASVREFAERAALELGIRRDDLRFGALEGQSGEMNHSAVNISRLRALAGWTPGTTIEQGVRATRDFLRPACSGRP